MCTMRTQMRETGSPLNLNDALGATPDDPGPYVMVFSDVAENAKLYHPPVHCVVRGAHSAASIEELSVIPDNYCRFRSGLTVESDPGIHIKDCHIGLSRYCDERMD